MKYHGKFEAPRKGRRLSSVAALALALVLLVSAGGTLAYLFTSTDPVENTFSPAEMGIVIHENGTNGLGDFDGKEKTNVYVENTSQADVYIRAAIVINWQDDEGNVVAVPVNYGDYTMKLSSDWVESGGYYYCTKANEKEQTKTVPLIVSCEPVTSTEYKLSVSILAQAIQAEPANVVTDAWGEISGLAKIAAAE